MPDPQPVLYERGQLENIAAQVIERFHKPPGSLPVDIELIIERDFGITILPFQELLTLYGFEAFIALSRKNIYVDPSLLDLDQNENRYRFTLAEELAHGILHRNLYQAISTPDDYHEMLMNIKPEIHDAMDRDAKHLAGAILMPASMYRERALQIFHEADRTKYKTSMELQVEIAAQLAPVFGVSGQASWVRFNKLGLPQGIHK